MKNYELLTIFKPNLDTDDVDKHIAKISEIVSNFGGSVNSSDKMGRKKLAYDIQNFRDGYFFSAILSIPADKVSEFRRQLSLNDAILRTMFLEAPAKASV